MSLDEKRKLKREVFWYKVGVRTLALELVTAALALIPASSARALQNGAEDMPD
jgi:hypothetical protein